MQNARAYRNSRALAQRDLVARAVATHPARQHAAPGCVRGQEIRVVSMRAVWHWAAVMAVIAPAAVSALKDGLDAQLFPCNAMSVRQAWALNPQTHQLHLRWRGVDPPLTQALVELPPGGGSPPRTSVGGQLSTWSVEQHGGHNASDRWQLLYTSSGGVRLVNNASGRCATSLGCNWSTQTRNCHDNQCHDAAACPVTAGDCDSEGAQWGWNETSGQLRNLAGDASKPNMVLCLDAGTTYPNTACSFGVNADAPFCDPSLSTAERARDLISKMTLDEKVNQLLSEAPAIPRLGIGRYQYWGEALHGQIGPGTTVFPQVRTWSSVWLH